MTDPLLSVEDHRDRILAAIRPLPAFDQPLMEAFGLSAAEDVHAEVARRGSRSIRSTPTATVDTLSAYSRIRSQPMIHAMNSPIVAYAYVYALPAIGTIAANSA